MRYIRMFGVKVFILVFKFRLVYVKLSDRVKAGILIGYSEDVKGYRIYLSDIREVVVLRSVIFDEAGILEDVYILADIIFF